MEKNNLEDGCNHDQDPGASNSRQLSRALLSNGNCSGLDLECFVAVKRLTPAEIVEMKQNLKKSGRNRSQSRSSKTQKNEDENAPRSVRVAKRQKPLTVENWTDSDLELEPITAITQSVTPPVSLSASSQIEIAPGCGIMRLPEEVFHHILGFVTFADVKASRLVNKQWRQMATTPLRRSSKEIRLDHQVFECVTKMDDGQFPVYRFQVQLNDDPENIKVCHPYFSGICDWVKELTLKVYMYLNASNKSQIWIRRDSFPTDCIYKHLTHFNLRVFEKTPNTRNSEFWQGFTDFVQSIMNNSPNLREVSVSCSNNKRDDLAICRVIEDLFPNPSSVGTSKLSCMDFQGVPLENIDLAEWFTLNLKLRKLAINVPRSSDLIDLLAVFLETQSGTLKELSLNVNRCDYKKGKAMTFTFPRMETLEQLGFTGLNMGVVVTFPGIDYVRLFPSLKKLELRNVGIDWKDFLGNNLLEPTNSVEELIFPWTGRHAKPVVTAGSLFPGLRRLKIHANSVVMKAVCESMPNLEVLRLTGSGCDYYSFADNIDYLITGMPLELCRMFHGLMTKKWIKKLKTVEGQSMARLQKLKTLRLWNRGSRLVCFSRLSFHVFQKMSSLTCLDLSGSADIQRSWGYKQNDEGERQFLADLREKFVVL